MKEAEAMNGSTPSGRTDALGDLPSDSASQREAPADAAAWLTLRRTSADDMQERELYASLDGKRIAILLYGDEPTLSISPGRHELRIHNTISRKKVEFDAAPGQHVRFETSNMRGRSFAYWAFFLGAAMMHTRLDREEDGDPPNGPVSSTFRVH
jgi:hypothetical protein